MALLTALRRINPADDDDFSIFLETLDDVVFEKTGTPLELFQLKHHSNAQASLTDASPDIWKSLRVWIEGRKSGIVKPLDRLVLITTQTVGKGSIASKLLATNRDEGAALTAMRNVAQTSVNAENAAAYTAFKALSSEEQKALVSSVVIAPNQPNIEQVGEDIRHEVRFTVRRDHVESFVSRLEGWWFTLCLRHLVGKSKEPLRCSALQVQMDDLRHQLVSALPVDDDIFEHEVEISSYESELFVHQARLTGAHHSRVLAAVRDYYRAFEQRSRWVREHLILVGDLEKYERTLHEEWEISFAQALDDLGPGAAEEAQQKMARAVFKWVESACFPIRKNVDHPSICRGSLHMMANELRIGWHPEFEARLRHLLAIPGVAA
ncbi:ABC-three component system protein [Xanthomonas euvesicatoria]